MRRLVAAFVENPVAANLVLLVVVVAGLVSLPGLRQETFPHVAFDQVVVRVDYPGAAPDEVEQSICVRLEELVHGVRGVDRVFARAAEGVGVVWAELGVGADAQEVLDEIRTRVDALDDLPADAEPPVVRELRDDSVLLGVAIHGHVDEATLRQLGERVRDELAALPEIHRAELVGVRAPELAVEVSEVALRRHGLGFDDVVAAVRASSLELPGGTLRTGAGEVLLRTQARAYRAPEFAALVLLTAPDGTRVRLGDVARVVDGFAESDEYVRFDGRPAAVVRVRSSEPRNPIAISEAVRAYVEALRPGLPAGLAADVSGDWSQPFRSRRDLLLRSGAQGLALILAVLALFLRLRLALWVTAGIPLAFLGALLVLPSAEVSINMMSLFAFIVALGLVVDDAIVVGENIDRHQRRCGDAVRGAVEGASEMIVPVSVAVLTTVLFLLPALSLPTQAGKVAYSLGVVVIACLVFSLVESLLVLPAHLAGHGGPPRDAAPRPLRRLQSRVAAALDRFVAGVYQPGLDAALRHPGFVAALSLGLLVLSVGVVSGGWVRWSFFPDAEDDYVYAQVLLPAGTRAGAVGAVMARLEKAAARVVARAEAETGAPVLDHVTASVGDAPYFHDDFGTGGDGPNVGRVRLELLPAEVRRVSSLELAERWREAVGAVPGALQLAFWGTDFGPGGADLDVALSGPDAAVDAAADALVARFAATAGVRDVGDSRTGGKQEVRLRIRPEAEAHGLTLAELARQVRQGFHGAEVQRIPRGRQDVRVVVRYPPAERRSLADLERIWVRTPRGDEVPFSAVARVERGRGYATIERRDRQRSVRIRADVDARSVDPRAVRAVLYGGLPALVASHPGVEYAVDGASREESEMLGALARGWLVALVAAYALLAVPLRSYLQPLLILAAVPFGFVGAVVGHWVLGLQLSAFSMIGLVALTGVVINDALVLIDRANGERRGGLSPRAAVREAGATRFRPILLTSLTTFFGLLPLLFERSAQADWLKPMAVTLAFGVVLATAITLVLVPAGYVMVEGLRDALGRRAAPAGDPADVRPVPVAAPRCAPRAAGGS